MVLSHKNSSLSADESAVILAENLKNENPYIYVRYGDGALECMAGKQGRTCDGEVYTPDLARELRQCWFTLFRKSNVFIGDWFTASFDSQSEQNRYAEQYNLIHQQAQRVATCFPVFVHFEALLLMRQTPELLMFYKTVKSDRRRKLLMGPTLWAPAAEMLGCAFHPLPVTPHLHAEGVDWIEYGLTHTDFDVLLYGAGMAGNVPVIEHWNMNPNRTYINLGSALDPLYRGRTRKQQLSVDEARSFFSVLNNISV